MVDRSHSRSRASLPSPLGSGALGAAGVLGLLALPQGWWPRCPVHALTGGFCPGCGAQRAIRAVLSGDLRLAVRYNALLFALPFFLLALRLVDGTRWEAIGRKWVILLSFMGVVVFTVARNVPGSALAPRD